MGNSNKEQLSNLEKSRAQTYDQVKKTGQGPDWAKNHVKQFPNASAEELAKWSVGSGDGNRGQEPASEAKARADAKAKADAKIAAEKKLKADNLTQGTANINNAFAPYDDNYYKSISQKYLDYYLPQVEDQYKKTNETLLYNLARNGILDSSARTDAYAESDKIYGEQKQDISSKASSFEGDARKYISDQKTSLLNQLNLTGGETSLASGFLGKTPTAISVTAPTAPNLSPLANLFDNITAIAKNETNAAMLSNKYGGGGGYANDFNKPLRTRGSSRFAD
jgi:hypothetical protein